MSGEKTRK